MIKIKAVFLYSFFFVFFSSCGILKNLGVEKRLYRPGYNIPHNSQKAVTVKNRTPDAKSAATSNRKNWDQRQTTEGVIQTDSSGTFHVNFNKKLKAIAAGKEKNVKKSVKKPGFVPIHKVETILETEKAVNAKSATLPAEGKTYTLSTVMFVIGSIFIVWGIAVLLAMLFPMMSTSIAIVLTIIIGILFVTIWGLVILIFKSWFNGTDDKKS